MNQNENPRAQAIVALVVVLLAAAISWKLFYHDPHAELRSLTDQAAQVQASQSAQSTPQVKTLYTADKQTIKAARSAGTPITSSALRQRVKKVAVASGIKILSITGSGDEVSLRGSGSDDQISTFLTGIGGTLRLDKDNQIRGSGPLIAVPTASVSGQTPAAETIQITVTSGK